MLTRLQIRNFKRFDDIDVELGQSVVFIGPNNSGKTTALQALSLWDIGLKKWKEKKGGKSSPKKRPGVTLNRRDLNAVPIPSASLLWKDLHVREGQQIVTQDKGKKTQTWNIRIDIIVDGVIQDKAWSCGLEFDYLNEESFACRPLRLPGHEEGNVRDAEFSSIPDVLLKNSTPGIKVAYLPPMSGLADQEFLKQQGEIDFLIGQGQTAQVLRNLCHRVYTDEEKGESAWKEIQEKIVSLFGVELHPPEYIAERGEIVMRYSEKSGEESGEKSGKKSE